MYNRNKNKLVCCNCGKPGHIYKKCQEPVTSFGIIAFKFDDGLEEILVNLGRNKTLNNPNVNDVIEKAIQDNIKFLLIRRKDTLGFVEFVRGRYNFDKVAMLVKSFDIMTVKERALIKKNNFDLLWNKLWSIDAGNPLKNKQYKKEYEQSKEKYYKLMAGVKNIDNKLISLDFILNKCKCNYTEQEWGMPKGRKNIKETYKECAIREFEEETGLSPNDYEINKDIKPLEEIFMGTNNVRYKHVYYVAKCVCSCNPLLDETNRLQMTEISDIRWLDYKTSINILRSYNIEKRNIIKIALKNIINHFTNKIIKGEL